jgi:diguanylate cyclase (GGDEF)-like protein
MRIPEKKPVARPDAARPAGEARPPETGEEAAPSRSILDVATVLGIPEAELTANVRRGLEQLLEEVDRLRRDLEVKQEQLVRMERLADEDPVVSVLNRRAFVRELSRMMAFAERYGAPSSLIYFDIDGMKAINDRFGHAAGDAALRHVVDTLAANVRGADILGRLGGDEFGVVLTHTDEAIGHKKAEDLAGRIADTPIRCAGEAVTVRVSYGVCAFRGGGEPADLLDRADRQMYSRKRRAGGGAGEGGETGGGGPAG